MALQLALSLVEPPHDFGHASYYVLIHRDEILLFALLIGSNTIQPDYGSAAPQLECFAGFFGTRSRAGYSPIRFVLPY